MLRAILDVSKYSSLYLRQIYLRFNSFKVFSCFEICIYLAAPKSVTDTEAHKKHKQYIKTAFFKSFSVTASINNLSLFCINKRNRWGEQEWQTFSFCFSYSSYTSYCLAIEFEFNIFEVSHNWGCSRKVTPIIQQYIE